MSFKFEVSQEGYDLHINLMGEIDERANLPSVEIPEQGKVVIQLENVTMINSNGARSWVNWIRHFEGAPGGVHLEKCPPIVVNQINILMGFMPGNGRVASFKVPYFCDACGHEERALWESGVRYQDNGQFEDPEDKPCPSCKETMSPDCLTQSYFRFLIRKRV